MGAARSKSNVVDTVAPWWVSGAEGGEVSVGRATGHGARVAEPRGARARTRAQTATHRRRRVVVNRRHKVARLAAEGGAAAGGESAWLAAGGAARGRACRARRGGEGRRSLSPPSSPRTVHVGIVAEPQQFVAASSVVLTGRLKPNGKAAAEVT